VKVLLSGAGGDDLFSGYRRHRALELQRLWAWLPGGVRGTIEQATARLDQRRSWSRRLAKLTSGAALDGDERIAHYFRWAGENTLRGLYSPAVRAALGTQQAAEPMLAFLGGLQTDTPQLERMLGLEQRFFLTDHNLVYTDKMSMAVGVEVRVPLLDLDLVEFAARIPPGIKQKGRIGKWVFKRAMEPYLPRHVIHRPKTGFGAPLRRWIRGDLKPLVNDLLGRDSIARRGIFDPAAVAALVAANDSGAVDASYTILSLLSIEIWCRRFLDAAPPAVSLSA
jgi:asparagine synthase (glutamine-hydrolysing)